MVLKEDFMFNERYFFAEDKKVMYYELSDKKGRLYPKGKSKLYITAKDKSSAVKVASNLNLSRGLMNVRDADGSIGRMLNQE